MFVPNFHRCCNSCEKGNEEGNNQDGGKGYSPDSGSKGSGPGHSEGDIPDSDYDCSGGEGDILDNDYNSG
jgi:hypothetical protein